MPISKTVFGSTADGIAIECYRLANKHDHHVSILTYGGIVQSLYVPNRNGYVSDVVLGFDTLLPYLEEHPYFGAIIGRYANRIALGHFKLGDHAYQLATNNGPNHLHGGLQGFDKQIWQASTEEKEETCTLTLTHASVDGDEGYPGTLNIEVRYTWDDHNALRIDYTAHTNAPTILNLTNHSYFNLANSPILNSSIQAQETEVQAPGILNHCVQLNADHYLPVDSTLIPTGEQAEVAGTCMDFRKVVNIGENMDLTFGQLQYANHGYDHAWLLHKNRPNHETLQDLPLAAIVVEPISGRCMQVYTTQPALQFYTGNFLDGSLIGKTNCRITNTAVSALKHNLTRIRQIAQNFLQQF